MCGHNCTYIDVIKDNYEKGEIDEYRFIGLIWEEIDKHSRDEDVKKATISFMKVCSPNPRFPVSSRDIYQKTGFQVESDGGSHNLLPWIKAGVIEKQKHGENATYILNSKFYEAMLNVVLGIIDEF
ncbi:MAG: hypothetical protein V1767_04640 [Chloroflexota bacterium]